MDVNQQDKGIRIEHPHLVRLAPVGALSPCPHAPRTLHDPIWYLAYGSNMKSSSFVSDDT